MDDISFLVNETLKNVENKKEKDRMPPAGSGVLYSLSENGSTFVIRGIASKNMKDDYKNFFERSFHEKLKLEEGEISQVFWYKTDFWELSCLILEIATQKRFLKKEERLSNLSDPSLSWGISDEGGVLTIDYSGKMTHKKDFTKLGYLGESSLAKLRLAQILKKEDNDHAMTMVKSDNQELYQRMKDLFYYSRYDELWWEEYLEENFEVNLAEALKFYLKEVVTMLCFWQQVNSQITLEN